MRSSSAPRRTQKPKKYDRPDATANAAISARLPYMMASSRIAHYLKVIARDKIGSFKEASDVETWLKRWIERYTNSNPSPSDEAKAKLSAARGAHPGRGDPGQAGLLQRGGAYAAVAADGGVDDIAAHGGSHPDAAHVSGGLFRPGNSP